MAHFKPVSVMPWINVRCAKKNRMMIGMSATVVTAISWPHHADQPGQQQTAYHVLVASSVEALAADQPDVWDSGVVQHARPSARYAGPALRSRARYWMAGPRLRSGRPALSLEPG